MAGSAERSKVEITMEVHIMRKKGDLEQEKKDITKTISAISNFQRRGVIKMKNLQCQGRTLKRGHHESVTAKHLDQWKKIVVQEAMKPMPNDWHVFEFCSQSQDSDYLYCYVKPAGRPITFEYNLHVPSASGDVTRVVGNFEEALDILIRGEPIVLPQLTSEIGQAHSNPVAPPPSFSEASAETFVGLFSDEGGLRNKDAALEDEKVRRMFEQKLSKLIGAVANSNGGDIKIEDSDSVTKLVDGKVCKNDQDVIVRCLEKCCKNKIWGRPRRNLSPKRGDHWDVRFPAVDEDNIVCIVHVEAFYGAVFEKEPVAFTLEKDKDGAHKVTRMKFEDWFNAMVKQQVEDRQEERETLARLHTLEESGSNPVCKSNQMTPYFETHGPFNQSLQLGK